MFFIAALSGAYASRTLAQDATANITPVAVTVEGQKSDKRRLKDSPEAVTVVDMRVARQQSSDLGEVLARTQGVGVQRDSGLGSSTRFSLNGMSGAAVKFFVDGIPLDEAGYPAIADIPVNLIERVEIYRGVVPVRFGADALGGAINIVTDQKAKRHFGASYQVGSFGTHRVNVNGRYRDADTGLSVGGSAYHDYSKNNYEIEARSVDSDGRAIPVRVNRNHDEYRGSGGQVEVGVAQRPWAQRLTLTGFVSNLEKQYQSNATQTIAYGELHGTTLQYGATLRYSVDLASNVALEFLANYSHTRDHLVDLSNWVYDWYGQRVRLRRVGGERDPRDKSDLITLEDRLFGRATVQWSLTHDHIVRLSNTSESPWRGGEERVVSIAGERNRGNARRRMVTVVTGLEYEANLLQERVANVLFAKSYWQQNLGEERINFVAGDTWAKRESTVHQLGVGDSLRVRVLPWLYTKASYEYAARLPEPEEFFGDGQLIGANYDLKPEVSHNGNLGARAELASDDLGELVIDVSGFIRDTRQQIMLVGLQYQTYVNVASTSGKGIESSLAWVSPSRYVALNGMFTWQNIRNTSTEGPDADHRGARVPSDPWLFASWGARLSFPHVFMREARIEPFYNGRYVHAFNRSWDDYGDPQFRVSVPDQVTQNVGVTWLVNRESRSLSVTAEVDNFTDARVFDFFGAQRPGRAFYMKIVGDLR